MYERPGHRVHNRRLGRILYNIIAGITLAIALLLSYASSMPAAPAEPQHIQVEQNAGSGVGSPWEDGPGSTTPPPDDISLH